MLCISGVERKGFCFPCVMELAVNIIIKEAVVDALEQVEY